jgi:hypothetical protein
MFNEVDRPPAWALPLDTTLEAARVETAVLRRLGPARRAAMTAEICETVRSLARAGVRDRHPDYNEHQVNLALGRLLVGDKLFREAFPDDSVAP